MAMLCDRCDVERVLQPMYEGAEKQGWYCPCCKSTLRTAAMIQEEGERHMAELGMTEAEYDVYCLTLINNEPLGIEMLEHARKMADRFEAEWTPACEHDTNPWAKGTA